MFSEQKAIKEAKAKYLKELREGKELYILMNKTNSSLMLPKPTRENHPRREIPAGGHFIGDEYHLKNCAQFVKFIKRIDPDSPNQDRQKTSGKKVVKLEDEKLHEENNRDIVSNIIAQDKKEKNSEEDDWI